MPTFTKAPNSPPREGTRPALVLAIIFLLMTALTGWAELPETKPGRTPPAKSATVAPKKVPEVTAEDYYRQALHFLKNAEWHKARAALDQAITLNPRFADALETRGAIFFEQGEYDKADQDYQHAIRLRFEVD